MVEHLNKPSVLLNLKTDIEGVTITKGNCLIRLRMSIVHQFEELTILDHNITVSLIEPLSPLTDLF